MATDYIAAPATPQSRISSGKRRFSVFCLLVCILLVALLSFSGIAVGSAEKALANPYQIFHNHYSAVGGLERLKKIRTIRSSGRIRYDSLIGTFHHWEESPLKHRTEEEYGVISQIDGDSGDQAWFSDPNGQLLFLRDPDIIKRRKIAVLLDRFEHLNPHSTVFKLDLGPEEVVAKRNCHHLILHNNINHDILHFYIDRENYHLLRSIAKRPDTEIIIDYDDFRWVDQLLIPHHSHSRYLPWGTEEETWTAIQEFNVAINQQRFQPPPMRHDVHFPSGTTSIAVPFHFVENQIFLPITIQGDTRYWLLDSGASMSVIDAEYARQLGLTAEGTIAGHGFGDNFSLGFVHLPGYRVGGISIDSQTIYSSKGLRQKSYEPEMYGVAGYDLLSRFVVELDYDRKTVTFHKPENFIYNGPGVVLDAPLKYRTFTLPVRLDYFPAGLWSLDLGAFRSSAHVPFAEKNGLFQRTGVKSVSQGMAGVIFEKLCRFNALRIGPYRLDQPIIAVANQNASGAATRAEVDGNLGNTTLRNFHLYLHYAKQQVIIEKGREFGNESAQDGSGLLLGRS